MAYGIQLQSWLVYFPPAFRIPPPMGMLFRKHGNPGICQCDRQMCLRVATPLRLPESSDELARVVNLLPTATTDTSDSGSGTAHSERTVRNLHKLESNRKWMPPWTNLDSSDQTPRREHSRRVKGAFDSELYGFIHRVPV